MDNLGVLLLLGIIIITILWVAIRLKEWPEPGKRPPTGPRPIDPRFGDIYTWNGFGWVTDQLLNFLTGDNCDVGYRWVEGFGWVQSEAIRRSAAECARLPFGPKPFNVIFGDIYTWAGLGWVLDVPALMTEARRLITEEAKSPPGDRPLNVPILIAEARRLMAGAKARRLAEAAEIDWLTAKEDKPIDPFFGDIYVQVGDHWDIDPVFIDFLADDD